MTLDLVWKFDNIGQERPLKEQLLRRQGDLNTIETSIKWYNKNPLHSNDLKRKVAHNGRVNHMNIVLKDIRKIQSQLKSI